MYILQLSEKEKMLLEETFKAAQIGNKTLLEAIEQECDTGVETCKNCKPYYDAVKSGLETFEALQSKISRMSKAN